MLEYLISWQIIVLFQCDALDVVGHAKLAT